MARKKENRKGKSIGGLIKHIRENHYVSIGGSGDERELLNMGYFHAYKAYRFVKNARHPLKIEDFSEIKDIHELDGDLNALLHPAVMKVETAISNLVIDCVVAGSGIGLEPIFEGKVNRYKDFERRNAKHAKETVKFLNLRKTLDSVIARNYVGREIIQHYVHAGREVPIWAIFEFITLGDLGNFIGRLNDETRGKLSENVGIRDKRFDDSDSFLSKHLYIMKDLRNAISHSRPIFDCRFRSGNVANLVLLLAYYMDCLKFDKSKIRLFIDSYEKLVVGYKQKTRSAENHRMIFDVDSLSKTKKFCSGRI
jgi:abortive infection bacteriophage resistance protein